MKLYPYQEKTISELRKGFLEHQRQVLCLPTGAGKTVVFSTIVEAAVKKGTKTLVLTDRLELFNQTVASIESLGIPVCKINGDNKRTHHSAVLYIGMVETVKRRLPQLQDIPFSLIVCDEAHVRNFNKIFDFWSKAHVIGATATPIGSHFHKYYTNLVSCIDTPELVEQGFLSPCVAYQMQDDFKDVKIAKNGEFEDASLFAHMDKAKLYEGVIEQWLLKCKGQQTICFCVNVKHTIKMTAAFNAAGIKAYCVHSNMDDTDRDWIIKEFNSKTFPVLLNCNIATKGFNCPAIECVILNRATTSQILFLQMIGRGSRLYPGKTHFTVLDFGLNHDRHGLWNESRTWEIKAPKRKSDKLGAAPVKTCPVCSAMLALTQKECPYCGYLFQPTEKELAQGRLVEVTNKIRNSIPGKYVSQCTIPELIELERTETIKPTYTWRVLRSRGAKEISEYARIKGYRDQWVMLQLESLEHEGDVKFVDKKINEISLM